MYVPPSPEFGPNYHPLLKIDLGPPLYLIYDHGQGENL